MKTRRVILALAVACTAIAAVLFMMTSFAEARDAPTAPIHSEPFDQPGDPFFAASEIGVFPYPPGAREPTEICVELRNPSDAPRTVEVLYGWANLGIGLPFEPIGPPIAHEIPPYATRHACTTWVPPVGGPFCIQVELNTVGENPPPPQFSQLNLDVTGPLAPGVGHVRTFAVGNFQNEFTNPDPVRTDIRLETELHLPGWEVELIPRLLSQVAPGEAHPVTLIVTPALGSLPLDADAWYRTPVVDIVAVLPDGTEPRVIGGFRKLVQPPVPLRHSRDPAYAASEIGVDPYPVLPSRPTRLSVQVGNPTDQDRLVTATFATAPFGIGLPFSTTHITPNPVHIYVPARGAARGHVTWHPPAWNGPFGVRVTLEMEGHAPIWSQRTVDVGGLLQPGKPHALTFPVGAWPYTTPVMVQLGLVGHLEGWATSLSQDEVTVQPGTPVSVTLYLTPPLGAELGSGEPIVDVKASVGNELLGGVRKLDRAPVSAHKPHEKRYAASEIVIDPDPPELGQPVRVGAVIHNICTDTFTITGRFSWAAFGVGTLFKTTGIEPAETTFAIGPQTTLTPTVTWTPQVGGPVCVRVELRDAEGTYAPQWSQRNVEVVVSPPCGQTQVYSFTVYNDAPVAATVDLGVSTLNVPADWEVKTTPDSTLDLEPYGEGEVEVQVRIPCARTLQQVGARQQVVALQAEAGSVPAIDVEGYIGGELVGGIELQFEPQAQRMIYLPLVTR